MRYLFLFCFLYTFSTMAQDKIPFESIPEAPEEMSSGAIITRMIQGLGYRYHWASKDLREEDLVYRPTPEAASTQETLMHLYGLAQTVFNTASGVPSKRPIDHIPADYMDLRAGTLDYLKQAAALFTGKNADEIAALSVTFERSGEQHPFSAWHLLNGPLADAIYHTGQLVSFRRTTGNPIQKGVNVFTGKTKQ